VLIFARDVFVVNANDANARAVVNIAAMNRSSGVRVCRSMSSDAAIDRSGRRDTRDRARDRGVITRRSYAHTDRSRAGRPTESAPTERSTDVPRTTESLRE